MRVSACQYAIQWESAEENFDVVDKLLRQTSLSQNGLIVLPEMFATGFSMNVDKIADHPDIQPYLSKLAVRHQSWVIAGYVARAQDGRGLNQALVYNPTGSLVQKYNKMHPFTFAGEDRSYAPGKEIVTIQIGDFCVCPLICYDLRFPEIFRSAALRGANLFTVIANWPQPRSAHWTALLQARAIENQAYVLGVNRTGSDPKLKYSGQSVLFDPQGRTIGKLDSEEGLLTGTLKRQEIDQWRQSFPALQDARHRFDPITPPQENSQPDDPVGETSCDTDPR